MKKIIAAVACFAVLFALSACSNKSKIAIVSLEDFANKTIGVEMGSTADVFVSELEIEGIKISRYNKCLDAIQALKQGKVDIVVTDDQPAKVFIEKNSDLKMLEGTVQKEDYGIAVAKSNKELTQSINKAIKKLKDNGTFDKIFGYYLNGMQGEKPYKSPDNIKYSKTLVMATFAEFPPYEYIEYGKPAGADIDFAKAIADELGVDLKIVDMKFDAVIASVQTGKADFAASALTITEDRAKSVDFTDAYYTASLVVIIRK